MSKVIATIEGEDIVENDDGTVSFTAKAAIDSDGSGPHFGDSTAQDDTSLHQDGEPLNSSVDKYIVVPPAIVRGVKGVVLGCQAHVTNKDNGLETDAVVGDVGPRHKLGEISISTAEALGIDSSPTHGGIDDHVIFYELTPGKAAIVDGKEYTLQPS